jgi:hypothetical protein
MLKHARVFLTAPLLLGSLVPIVPACTEPVATDGDPTDGDDASEGDDPTMPDGEDGDPDDGPGEDDEAPGDGTGDGTEDGEDEPDDPGALVPTTLIPVAFGGLMANDATPDAGEPTLANARLGTSAVDPGGEVTGQSHRMRVWLPAIGAGEVGIAATVQDGFGEPLQGPAELDLQIRGFDGPALVPSSELFSEVVVAKIEQGHLRATFPLAVASILADQPELWLTFTLDGDDLSPSVRMSPVAHTVAADTFDAGGVRARDGVRLPVEAREATAMVVSGLYRPGDLVEGLPDPAKWTCTHRANVLGYPRTSGHPVVLQQCKPGLPAVSLWEGTQTVAVATVGGMEFTSVLDTDEWSHMIHAPCEDNGVEGCLPRITVRRFEQSLSYQCEPYQMEDAPRPTHSWADGDWLDEITDPGAADIQVHVLSTCTYDLSWSTDFGESDP